MASRLRLFAAIVFLATCAFGCTAKSEFMRPVTAAGPMSAPPDKALIYFVRTSSLGSAVTITIIDDQGRFVGDSLPGKRFALAVDPGQHLFIAWTEGIEALLADVAPGKVYWVEVRPKMGVWSARAALYAAHRQSDLWKERAGWERDTELVVADLVRGQAYLNSMPEKLAEAVRDGKAAYAGYSEADKQDATLRPQDAD
jgi:hypothetical protein